MNEIPEVFCEPCPFGRAVGDDAKPVGGFNMIRTVVPLVQRLG